MSDLNRRAWLRLAGLGSAAGGACWAAERRAARRCRQFDRGDAACCSPGGPGGTSLARGFQPDDLSCVPGTSPIGPRPSALDTTARRSARTGQLLREYQLVAIDREIEIAPGVYFPAWTYNGQVPGPTIRATEGDRIRVNFLNQGSHPHTIHFHGWHPPEMDGSLPEHQVMPGQRFVYEFDAEPFGLHLYHCHALPLKRHIHKGLYGAFIVDPKGGRPPADELVMMMNGFDTNFDADNEVYAVNTVANHYMHDPIRAEIGAWCGCT